MRFVSIITGGTKTSERRIQQPSRLRTRALAYDNLQLNHP